MKTFQIGCIAVLIRIMELSGYETSSCKAFVHEKIDIASIQSGLARFKSKTEPQRFTQSSGEIIHFHIILKFPVICLIITSGLLE